ncbi:MAG: bifunctional diaminohydroxyphosphoribosylaminopyrimidine deaminase/5-amino-6-(5-phosphoribosylamino)uracil reductase RibD [Pseudomonadota bacterium]
MASESVSSLDRRFLDVAIRLGKSRIGRCAPNPSVGAIIVDTSTETPVVIGRGVTGDRGRPHGEVIALGEAGARAKGATCYVSLEPCAHHGKTPPCVDALIKAGVARVVVAKIDPDPRVSGKGLDTLRQHGVVVSVDDKRPEARDSQLGHDVRASHARPAFKLKLAISPDGKIGLREEGNVPVTGEAVRARVHALRARSDAILIGIGTALADDPELTCRLDGMADWSPERVVLDSEARLPLSSKLVAGLDKVPLRVLTSESANSQRVAALEARGVKAERLPASLSGISIPDIGKALYRAGHTSVMIEGGSVVARSFLDGGFIDEAYIFLGQTPIGENGVDILPNGESIDEALERAGLERSHPDESIEGDRLVRWSKP